MAIRITRMPESYPRRLTWIVALSTASLVLSMVAIVLLLVTR